MRAASKELLLTTLHPPGDATPRAPDTSAIPRWARLVIGTVTAILLLPWALFMLALSVLAIAPLVPFVFAEMLLFLQGDRRARPLRSHA